jgi:hypothetical protein
MMKKIMIITMPLILAVSVIMVLNSANVNVFGQANQTSPQANQTSPQANNQSSTGGGNQTSASQNSTSMNEQLLNYTNNAIKAQKDKKGSDLTDNLKKLQEALIKSSGKQVVIVPDTSSSGSSSSGSSSGDKSSSSSSGDKSSSSSSGDKSKSK